MRKKRIWYGAVILAAVFLCVGCDQQHVVEGTPLTAITIAAITGIEPPATGGVPVTAITPTDQYTGTVAWNPNPDTFAASTPYTATITVKAKQGYTLAGVKVNFFTVAGAVCTNTAGSGIVTAVFPKTPDPIPVITITGQPEASTTVTKGSISGSLSVTANVTQNAALGYQWYFNTSNSSTGGTKINGATNAAFTIPTDLTEGTYYYYCVITAPAGAVSVTSNTAAVIVDLRPVITITSQPAATTFVTESNITGNLTVAAAVTKEETLGYQWYSNTTDTNTGGTVINGETNASFTIPVTLTADGTTAKTYYYYCEISATGGAVSVNSDAAAVTVKPHPVITITTQPQAVTTVTEGNITGNLTVEANVTEGKTPAYQWYSNTSDSITGSKAIDGQANAVFTIPTNLTAGTYYYFCEVSADQAVTVRSNAAAVMVRPVITITGQPKAAVTVIAGSGIDGSLTAAANVSSGGTPIFQWYSNTTNTTTGGKAISGQTNATLAIPTDLAIGTYYYFCEVSAAGADSKYSDIATVTVKERPVITVTGQPAAATNVTEGSITGSLTVAVNVSDNTPPVYQWYFNNSGTNMGGSKINGQTTAEFTIPVNLKTGTFYYYCEVSAEGGESVYSDAAVVVVGPAINITTQPKNTTVTEGGISGNLTAAASISDNKTLYYQWYSNTSNSTTGGKLIDGQTNITFTIPTDLAIGTYYYYCVIGADKTVSVYSDVAAVTVSRIITITTQPANTAVIEGKITGSLTMSANVTDGTTPAYQWYSNTGNSTTGGSIISGEINAAFTIPADLTPGRYYYFCEVSAAGADSKNSTVVTVTVNPRPVIIITIQPKAATTVTEGSITGYLSMFAYCSYGETRSYQWYSNTSNSTTGGTIISGETNNMFAIPTNLTAGTTYYYFCEVSAEGAVSVRSNAAAVTVNTDGKFVIQLTSITEADLIPQTAYTAANTDTPFTISGTGYTAYQWYLNGVPAGTSSTYTFNQDAGAHELAVVVTDTAGRKHSGSCRVTVR